MCLKLITPDYCIAKGRITVYKILRKCGNKYITPYQGVEVDLKKGQQDTIETLYDSVVNFGIHCYSDKYFAMAMLSAGDKVFECYIPKGTKYYIGTNSDIVCEDLRYVQEIKDVPKIKAFLTDTTHKDIIKKDLGRTFVLINTSENLEIGKEYHKDCAAPYYHHNYECGLIFMEGFSVYVDSTFIRNIYGTYVVEIPIDSRVIINNTSGDIIFTDTIKVIEKCV